MLHRETAILILLILASGCGSISRLPSSSQAKPVVATVPAGRMSADLYLPTSSTKSAPLVIIAHGWTRTKTNMWGWGEHLAAQGFAVAIPNLPTLSDHPRNGRAMAQLIGYLREHPPAGSSIDCSRVGLVGFSAGGLAAFLGAAESSDVKVWVGLDPVELRGLGAAKAAEVRCAGLVLLAEPRGWNKNGNWQRVEAAAPGRRVNLWVNNATHADCEWPTDPATRWTCGEADPLRQRVFIEYTTAMLRAELMDDPDARAFMARAGQDGRISRRWGTDEHR